MQVKIATILSGWKLLHKCTKVLSLEQILWEKKMFIYVRNSSQDVRNIYQKKRPWFSKKKWQPKVKVSLGVDEICNKTLQMPRKNLSHLTNCSTCTPHSLFIQVFFLLATLFSSCSCVFCTHTPRLPLGEGEIRVGGTTVNTSSSSSSSTSTWGWGHSSPPQGGRGGVIRSQHPKKSGVSQSSGMRRERERKNGSLASWEAPTQLKRRRGEERRGPFSLSLLSLSLSFLSFRERESFWC